VYEALSCAGAHRLTREIQKIKTEAKSAVEEAQRELVSIKQVCGLKLLAYEALSYQCMRP
jgi:hypothetical protein